jgi:hypothetical protein
LDLHLEILDHSPRDGNWAVELASCGRAKAIALGREALEILPSGIRRDTCKASAEPSKVSITVSAERPRRTGAQLS